MKMEKRELRPFVLQALQGNFNTQIASLEHRVKDLLPDASFLDALLFREIVWDFLVQGILAPGYNRSNLDLPFIHVTEFGRECLNTDTILPYDPDGYLVQLQNLIENDLDETVQNYIQESLTTFLTGNYMAATVMLGVASERCVDMLVEALLLSIEDDAEKLEFEKAIRKSGRSVKRRFDVVREKIFSLNLPSELRDALDIQMSGIFTLIRYSRNDAGHPSDVVISREVAHANLLLFPQYCKRVYGLLECFGYFCEHNGN